MQFVIPQEAKLLFYINIFCYSSVWVFFKAIHHQTVKEERGAKAYPCNPHSLCLLSCWVNLGASSPLFMLPVSTLPHLTPSSYQRCPSWSWCWWKKGVLEEWRVDKERTCEKRWKQSDEEREAQMTGFWLSWILSFKTLKKVWWEKKIRSNYLTFYSKQDLLKQDKRQGLCKTSADRERMTERSGKVGRKEWRKWASERKWRIERWDQRDKTKCGGRWGRIRTIKICRTYQKAL